MHKPPDILALAYKQPLMQDQLCVLHEKERQIPGSVQYTIKRYHKNPQWNVEDTGMLVYHYEKTDVKQNFVELRFCVTGNVYCKQKDTECDMCKFNASKNCVERMDSLDILSFRFSPVHLSQFNKPGKNNSTISSDIL